MLIPILLSYGLMLALNLIFQRSTNKFDAIGLAIVVSLLVSGTFQAVDYFYQGYLDPFFIIAIFVQTGIGVGIGLLVWVLKLKKWKTKRY